MPVAELHIPTETTDTYPTRYVAFDKPGVLIIHEGDHEHGPEAAVYSEPMTNAEYPHLTDGIYCEVSYRSGKGIQNPGYVVDCHATAPSAARTQRGWMKRIPSYHPVTGWVAALEQADKFIAEAQAWLVEGARA